MVIFHSYVSLPEGNEKSWDLPHPFCLMLRGACSTSWVFSRCPLPAKFSVQKAGQVPLVAMAGVQKFIPWLWKDDIFFSPIFLLRHHEDFTFFTSHQENMMVCIVYLKFWDTSEVTTCHNHRYVNFHFMRFIGSPIQCRRCLSSSNFRRISGGGWGLEYSLGVSLPQRLGACLNRITIVGCWLISFVHLALHWWF